MEEHGANTSNESRSSDHSAALAEKLPQGWALLQEHCPQCLTPLVRNRHRKMYCVACAQWVVTQSEAAEQLARERVEKGASESPEKGDSESIGEPIPPTEPSTVPMSTSLNMTWNERQASPLSPLPAPSSVPISSSHVTTENERQVEIIDLVEPSGPSFGTGLSLACTQDAQPPSNKGEVLIIPKASLSLPCLPRPSIEGFSQHAAMSPSSPPRASAATGLSTAIDPPSSVLAAGMGHLARISTTSTFPIVGNVDCSMDFAGASSEVLPTAATPLILNPMEPSSGDGSEVLEVLMRRKRKQASEKARRAKMAVGNTPMVRDNWTIEEFRALAEAKRRLEDELSLAKGKNNNVTMHERWHRIAEWAREKGIMRTPLQCRDKWENHFPRFKKILDWEKAIPSGMPSYWHMESQDRKLHGLPTSFDRSMYDILEAGFGRELHADPSNATVDSSSQTLVNNGSKSKENGSDVAGHAEEQEGSSARDNISTGKKKRVKEARQSIFMRDYFEDISRNLMEEIQKRNLMEEIQKTAMKRTKVQAQMQELLAIQERQAKAGMEERQAKAANEQLDHRPKTLEQVLPNVSVILSHKLEEIGNALLASQDVNQIRLLMNALRECFNTVEALQKLQGV